MHSKVNNWDSKNNNLLIAGGSVEAPKFRCLSLKILHQVFADDHRSDQTIDRQDNQ